jgi:hypothetical protein
MSAKRVGRPRKEPQENGEVNLTIRIETVEKDALMAEKKKSGYSSLRDMFVDRCLPAAVKQRLKKK